MTVAEYKTTQPAEVAVDEKRGRVTCVFSSFSVVDLQGDVVLPGAMPPNGTAVVLSAYNHASHDNSIPLGWGTIRSTATEAIAELEFLMANQAAAETFRIVAELSKRGLQEYSYSLSAVTAKRGTWKGRPGVRVISKIGQVKEVSPVLLGASIGTRTLSTHLGTADEAELQSIYDRWIGEPERTAQDALMAEYRRALELMGAPT